MTSVRLSAPMLIKKSSSVLRRCLSLSMNPCLPSSSATVTVSSTAQQKLKSYSDIPKHKGFLPNIIHLLLAGGPNYLHEYCDQLHNKLGPIFREKLGSTELIFLSDTRFIRHVLANEGPYPNQVIPECWAHFNKVNNIERGMFFLQGEPWLKLRKTFNKILLGNHVSQYSKGILNINNNLIDFWEHKSDGFDIIIDDVHAELNKWSIESMGMMLFDRRMGCVQEDPRSTGHDNRPDRLVEKVATMFIETSNLQSLPVKLAYKLNLRPWRRFSEASFSMLDLATELTTEHIKLSKGSPENKGLVGELLKTNSLTEEELVKSIVDLIIAAADTTSNALQWQFYLIAKDQDIQDKIYNEAVQLMDELNDDLDKFYERAIYLKAFIKESLRLYPTAPFIARKIDKQLVLDSYSIPAGNSYVFSCYTTSRSEKYFDSPNECKPERWLRSNRMSKCPSNTVTHAYATLPFGLGARACIGRRAAELEMALLIASLVTKFKVDLMSNPDVKVKLRMILNPARPISIRLRRR